LMKWGGGEGEKGELGKKRPRLCVRACVYKKKRPPHRGPRFKFRIKRTSQLNKGARQC
jgi:hypothetical protein